MGGSPCLISMLRGIAAKASRVSSSDGTRTPRPRKGCVPSISKRKPGVVAPDLREVELPHRARAVRRALEGIVVNHHDDAVARGVHVELEHAGAVADGALEGDESVLRRHAGGAAMAEHTGPRA